MTIYSIKCFSTYNMHNCMLSISDRSIALKKKIIVFEKVMEI